MLFAAISVQYAVAAVRLAAHAPLWMDEVLAVRTARLESPTSIWRALVKGAEFSPPLYDLLLGGLHAMGIGGAFALRVPSIVAAYIAALATGMTAWRRNGSLAAALAAAAVLSSGLFDVAVQARPYALIVAVFALALLATDRIDRFPLSPFRTALLTSLLALLVGLHFYAILLVVLLALIEWRRACIEQRPVSRGMVMACAFAGLSFGFWWPILDAARRFAGADAAMPDYYARPTLAALARSYGAVTGWLILPLAGLLIAALARRPERLARPSVATVMLLAFPMLVFVFALTVSHSYADRYAIAATLGVALLLVVAVEWQGERKEPSALALLAVMLIGNNWRSGGEIAKQDRIEALSVVETASGHDPIVTGSGLRFLEILENASPAIARRLIFVDVPDVVTTDPTNRNQVLRWKAIDPTIRVIDARTLVCSPGPFTLFAQPVGGGADPLPAWLMERGFATPPPDAGATLVTEHARGCERR